CHLNDPMTTAVSTLSLHDALPISARALHDVAGRGRHVAKLRRRAGQDRLGQRGIAPADRGMPRELRVRDRGADVDAVAAYVDRVDRKSTRLNFSHVKISYAVFCLK